ncbi:aldo/keto reductase [Brevibacillus dissolubilis]|uniref:aldo/keto reductase n=1 Tax=Brevibacillus dissolubilis TaxID=1844116 RepID=UPI001115E58F|nr:aldo/keto reductase [Brevibacillus dissolubilis]
MKYRTMAGTNIQVSEIGFGVWSVATKWWGVTDTGLAKKLLRSAYEDYGITFFDTADVYAQGWGETILAETFSDIRDKIVIGTKFGYDIYNLPGERQGHSELPQNWSKEHIIYACEQSLRRLGTETIDLYQLHNPRMDALCKDEVTEALERLKEAGKIREYGAAIGPDIGWKDEAIAAITNPGVKGVQIINNIVEQEPARDLFTVADREERSLIVRVPHASGLLDGTYDPQKHFDKTDHRNHRPLEWMKAGMEVVEHLKSYQMFNSEHRTLGQLAIQFSLYRPSVITVLPNFTSEANLKEFAAASETAPLTDAEFQLIDSLWTGGYHARLAQHMSDSTNKPTPTLHHT